MLGVGLTDEEGGDGEHSMHERGRYLAGGFLRCCGERTESGEGPLRLLVVVFGGCLWCSRCHRWAPSLQVRSGRGLT
jgi:hypothetical protein